MLDAAKHDFRSKKNMSLNQMSSITLLAKAMPRFFVEEYNLS